MLRLDHPLLAMCFVVFAPTVQGQIVSPETKQALTDLGSNKFAERKKAAAFLRDLPADEQLERELMKLCRVTDAEVAASASALLRSRLNAQFKTSAGKIDDTDLLKRVMSERGFDFFAHWLSAAGLKATDDHWNILYSTIDDFILPALQKIEPKFTLSDRYKKAKPTADLKRYQAGYKFCCDELAEPDHISSSIVVSTGPVQYRNMTMLSLIVALGPVKLGGTFNSLILADDNVEVVGGGHVAIISTGSLRFQLTKAPPVICISDAKEKFPAIRFSSLADFGVSLRDKGGHWAFSEIRENSPFADGKVEVGDIVLSANGIAVEDPQSLRRMIRESCFTGKLFLSVKRSDSVVDLVVKLQLLPK